MSIIRCLNNHISDEAIGSYNLSSFLLRTNCARKVRVESAKACVIPDLLCSLGTFGISYWIRPLFPYPPSSPYHPAPSSPQCERYRLLGYTPYRWKGLDLQEGNPNFHRAEGPPPNSMGQESQDLERRCTLEISPSFLYCCPARFLNDHVLRS